MPTAIPENHEASSERFLQRGRDLLIRFVGGKGPGARAPREEPDPSAPELELWACRLQEEKDFLLSFVHGVETEFLRTGEGLCGLSQEMNTTQQECRSLIGIISGNSEVNAVQFAFQLLSRTEDLLLACYDQYDQSFAAFGELRQQLAQLYKQNQDLRRVLLPLSFITTAFRVEAVRHTPEVQEVFLALARTVEQTMNEVRGTLDRQFEELAASEEVAAAQMAQVAEVVQNHRVEVASTLKDSRRQLRALNEVFSGSGTRAEELSHLGQMVKRHINSIVVAQQCHDITRQKIEHVGEGMEVMRTHLLKGVTSEDPHRNEERQLSYQLGMIQLQQVRNVFHELTEAAGNLKTSVLSLRSGTSAATRAAEEVGATTRDARAAAQCEISIGAMLSMIEQALQNSVDILTAFEPLQASFVKCTSKATELAGDVRLAALNAQVFAVNTPEGAVLEVLAGRMREISDSSFDQVDRLEIALLNISEMISNLRERLGEFQVLGRMEQEILTAESILSRDGFAALEQAIASQVGSIDRHQRLFASSVEEVLAAIRFPDTVADASSRSLEFFDDLIAWGKEFEAPLSLDSVANKTLQQIQSSYTMESERVAHADVLEKSLLPLEGASLAVASVGAEKAPVQCPPRATDPRAAAGSALAVDPMRLEPSSETAPVLAGVTAPSGGIPSGQNPELGDNVELF